MSPTDLPAHAALIGRDSRGFDHHYSPLAHTLFVTRDDTVAHTRHFDRAPTAMLEGWIAAIDARGDGWAELHYVDGGMDAWLDAALTA